MSGDVKLIGAAPLLLQDKPRSVLLGCACGKAFMAACSLVVQGGRHRDRIDLTAQEAAAIAEVAGGQRDAVAYARRDGADCILVVGTLRILLRGDDLQADLSEELRRRSTGPTPITGACDG